MDIEQDYSLQFFNTLRLPVRARYFISVDTIDSLRAAIAFTRDRDLPMIVLGGGSNVVLRDPYPGCVLHVQLLGETVLEETDESVCLRVAAGEAWHSLVMRCHERGWYGLENLALIPGTVGAAPIQNIGAYGVEVSEFLSEVEVIERASGERRVLTNAECGFGYRHSRFKDAWAERFVIASITLKILPRAEPRTDYPALRAELESAGGRLRARDVLDAIIGIRRQKLPEQTLPTIAFLHRIHATRAARLRVVDALLLAVRVALVAALVLAASAPFRVVQSSLVDRQHAGTQPLEVGE